MCLHCVLCFIPVNLICNKTTFRKGKMTFKPHSWGQGCLYGQARHRIMAGYIQNYFFKVLVGAQNRVCRVRFICNFANVCKDKLFASMFLYASLP